MARVAMVTRTMLTTKVDVMMLNIVTATLATKQITLAGTFKDEKSLLKAVKVSVDNVTEKAVHVVKSEDVETLYGMTEDDFIKNAKVLPARGSKPEETATTEAK